MSRECHKESDTSSHREECDCDVEKCINCIMNDAIVCESLEYPDDSNEKQHRTNNGESQIL